VPLETQINLLSLIRKVAITRLLISLAVSAFTGCAYTATTGADYFQNTSISEPVFNDISAVPVAGFSTCRLLPQDFLLLTDIATRRRVPNTENSKEGKRIALSAREMNEWGEVISRMENVPVPLVFDTEIARPVFVAVFDGTWNDREAKDEPLTVPGHLSLELEAMAATVKGLRVKYYHGVGTRVSWSRRIWEGMTGLGTRERAEEALRDLQAFAAHEAKTPHVYTIGFSRGAASARHFLNLVDDVLQASPVVEGSSLDHARSFALLFDTVATGQTHRLSLGIPQTTAAAYHFVATRERRITFPVVSLSRDDAERIPGQRVLEIALPGAHSDLGGGYGQGLEELSLAIARNLLAREGFSVREPPNRLQETLNIGRHNSDWVGTAWANAILGLAHPAGRMRIEPRSKENNSNEDTSTSNFVEALLEQSMREIAAEKSELERIQDASRKGVLPVFDGLSIQLESDGAALIVTTNCPQSVSFDINSRWIFLDGRPFILLSQNAVEQAKAGTGLVMVFDKQDPEAFAPAATLH